VTSTGAKLWLAITALALGATVVYAVASDGEWFGSVVLGTVVVGAALLAAVSLVTGDGDIQVGAPDPVPAVARRTAPAPWPPLVAFGAGALLIGLAGGTALFWAGLLVLFLAAVEWLIQGWAERATGDPEANRELRNRLLLPFEVPVAAALGVLFLVLSFSRVLLAIPKAGSTVVAIVVAATILGVASLIALRPQLRSSVVSGIVGLGAVLFLAAGIAGAVAGERDIEHHGDDHAEEPAGGEADE
jgi:hypothetical protein